MKNHKSIHPPIHLLHEKAGSMVNTKKSHPVLSNQSKPLLQGIHIQKQKQKKKRKEASNIQYTTSRYKKQAKTRDIKSRLVPYA